MVRISSRPKFGEWYLSVTCPGCKCRSLIFRDLNEGRGSINGCVGIICPRCKSAQILPVEHYQHRERRKPDVSIEIL